MQNFWDGICNALPTLGTVETQGEDSEQDGFEVVDEGPPDVQMAEVCSSVFFGSKNVASDRELLRSRGVTHIINVTSEIANHFPEDFVYKRVEILDMPEMDIKSHFAPCIEFIDQAIVTGGAVYIHCYAGMSRSASICLAYLISREQMELDRALKHIRRLRDCVRPNEGFMTQLQAFQRGIMESAS